MKFNPLYLVIVSLSLTLLVACNNNQATDNNMNDTISSLSTDSTSENYPHTRPIKTQDAKYDFETTEAENNPIQNNSQNQSTQQQNNTQMNQANQQQWTPEQAQIQQNPQNNQGTSDFITSVIELTNNERQNQGLPPLKAYPELNDVATKKAQDLNAKNYFSHTSPTYGSPFDMMRDFGISYQSAGENIAQGQRAPKEVVNAWMNSEGHRANILSEKFTHIGVGFEKSGYQWVQMFVKK